MVSKILNLQWKSNTLQPPFFISDYYLYHEEFIIERSTFLYFFIVGLNWCFEVVKFKNTHTHTKYDSIFHSFLLHINCYFTCVHFCSPDLFINFHILSGFQKNQVRRLITFRNFSIILTYITIDIYTLSPTTLHFCTLHIYLYSSGIFIVSNQIIKYSMACTHYNLFFCFWATYK